MARVKTLPGDPSAPTIDNAAVADFFEARASKYASLGPVQTVIYQDKNPDLAKQRDVHEKGLLLPILALEPQLRVLDIGCGTGRWVSEIAPLCGFYHGSDFSAGLLAIARELHGHRPNVRFTQAGADEMSLQRLGEAAPFDRVMMFGLLIYLNDAQVAAALSALPGLCAPGGRIVMREPVGIEQRLTIREHFSEDMEQTYNAIYRTEGEIRAMMDHALGPEFSISDSGDVFAGTALNNRSDTVQRWFVVERRP